LPANILGQKIQEVMGVYIECILANKNTASDNLRDERSRILGQKIQEVTRQKFAFFG
jgi:hypothetical protein